MTDLYVLIFQNLKTCGRLNFWATPLCNMHKQKLFTFLISLNDISTFLFSSIAFRATKNSWPFLSRLQCSLNRSPVLRRQFAFDSYPWQGIFQKKSIRTVRFTKQPLYVFDSLISLYLYHFKLCWKMPGCHLGLIYDVLLHIMYFCFSEKF